MSKLRTLDLFAGIGGFSLGLEATGGFETVAFCENAPRPRQTLAKQWPGVPIYEDVRDLTAARLSADGITVDCITGGFPCQDASVANAGGKGTDGERTGLYREVVRLIGEMGPQIVLLENVANLINRGFGDVLGGMVEVGYDAEWHCIPASYVGAWHRRDRIWILAYPRQQRDGQGQSAQPILRQHHLSRKPSRVFAQWPGRSNLPAPTLHRGDNGLSAELDCHGNAVVPQIPELIGHAILEAREASRKAA